MSDSIVVRGRDGDLTPAPDDTPACICDGTGLAGTVLIPQPDGRPKEVVRVCRACRPDTARRLPTVAERAAGHGMGRRRRLAVVR